MAQFRTFDPIANGVAFGKALGGGAYRTAYPIGKEYVVKVERGYMGKYESNEREIKIWNIVRDSDAATLFCPILAHAPDNSAVIQPRVRIMDHALEPYQKRKDAEKYGSKEWHKRREQLNKVMRTLNVERTAFVARLSAACSPHKIVVHDLHEGNIGWDASGNMIVVDYGNFRIQNW